jgi:hypothetical protein
VPAPPPLPAGHQCLPAMICDDWSGCALVAAGKVVAADRLKAGAPVTVANVCSTGVTCIAARGIAPAGVTCPLHLVPPVIAPPPYTCAWDGAACKQR